MTTAISCCKGGNGIKLRYPNPLVVLVMPVLCLVALQFSSLAALVEHHSNSSTSSSSFLPPPREKLQQHREMDSMISTRTVNRPKDIVSSPSIAQNNTNKIITANMMKHTTISPVDQKDPCSSIKEQLRNKNIVNPLQERLDFLHIPKTGGTAIECIGVKHGIRWGAAHYQKFCNCHKRDCDEEDDNNNNNSNNSTTITATTNNITCIAGNKLPLQLYHPRYRIARWHLPLRYHFQVQPTEMITAPIHTFSYNNDKDDDADVDLCNKYNSYNPYENSTVIFAFVRNPYERILSHWMWLKRKPRNKRKRNNATLLNDELIDSLTRLRRGAYFGNRGHMVPQSDYIFDECSIPQFQECSVKRNNLDVGIIGDYHGGITTPTTSSSGGNDHGKRRRQAILALKYEHFDQEFQCLMKEFQLNITLPSYVNVGKQSTLTIANFTTDTRNLIEAIYAKDFDAFGYEKIKEDDN